IATPDDTKLKVSDAENGQGVVTFKEARHPVSTVAYTTDGERIVAGGYGEALWIWDARTGQEVREGRIPEGRKVDCVRLALSRDGEWIAGAGSDGTITIWDAQTGREKVVLPRQTNRVSNVAFSPDGKRI